MPQPAGLPLGQHMDNIAVTLAAALLRNRGTTDAKTAAKFFFEVKEALKHPDPAE